MMQVLSPTYTLTITIKDRADRQDMQSAQAYAIGGTLSAPPSPHKFYDYARSKTGCDEAVAAVKDALAKAGITADVQLDRFARKKR